MERSRLSLHLWMTAFMLLAATRKGFSCLEFLRQLGLTGYDTAFRLMHKIRVVIGRRDALSTLTDMIEMDECFIGVATKKKVKEHLKRGKGSQRKAIVRFQLNQSHWKI